MAGFSLSSFSPASSNGAWGASDAADDGADAGRLDHALGQILLRIVIVLLDHVLGELLEGFLATLGEHLGAELHDDAIELAGHRQWYPLEQHLHRQLLGDAWDAADAQRVLQLLWRGATVDRPLQRLVGRLRIAGASRDRLPATGMKLTAMCGMVEPRPEKIALVHESSKSCAALKVSWLQSLVASPAL